MAEIKCFSVECRSHAIPHSVRISAQYIAYTRFYAHTKNTIVHGTIARSELYIYSFQNSCWLRVKNIYLRFIFTFSSRSLSPLCRRQALVVMVVVAVGAWAPKPSQTEHNFRWFKHLRVAQLIWHLCTGARLRKKKNNNEKRKRTNTLTQRSAKRSQQSEQTITKRNKVYTVFNIETQERWGRAKMFEIYIFQ